MEGLKTILGKLPIGGGSDKAEQAEEIKQKAFDFNPDNYAPKEVQDQLLQILKWRDDVYRDIIKKIEMVPGLNDLIDELTNALNACESDCHPLCPESIDKFIFQDIYTVLAPWLTVGEIKHLYFLLKMTRLLSAHHATSYWSIRSRK